MAFGECLNSIKKLKTVRSGGRNDRWWGDQGGRNMPNAQSSCFAPSRLIVFCLIFFETAGILMDLPEFEVLNFVSVSLTAKSGRSETRMV